MVFFYKCNYFSQHIWKQSFFEMGESILVLPCYCTDIWVFRYYCCESVLLALSLNHKSPWLFNPWSSLIIFLTYFMETFCAKVIYAFLHFSNHKSSVLLAVFSHVHGFSLNTNSFTQIQGVHLSVSLFPKY